MGRWYSYQGSSPSQGQKSDDMWREVMDSQEKNQFTNPLAKEYYEARKRRGGHSHTASGFHVGEEIWMNGVPAKVIHEERDQHSGQIETWVQESSENDSGTKKIKWVPGDNDRQIVARDITKVTE